MERSEKMKSWTERLKKKKGAYSIITVTLALIMVLSFTGYTDILTKTYTLNEVQQRLDTSGLNTLNESIDTDRLVLEELALDENNKVGNGYKLTTTFKNKVETKYKQEVYKQIKTNDTVKNIQVRRVNVTMDDSTWGTGVEGQSYPQLTLDAVIYLEVDKSHQFDLGGTNTKEFYDAQSGTNFSIQMVDSKEDGVEAMLVRSSTRVVYR